MTQLIKKLKPVSVNTDTSSAYLKPSESPFLKGYDVSFTKDASASEGGNFGKGKRMPSNYKTIAMDMPDKGINKTVGFYEAVELNEAYVFGWNSVGLHSIYRLDGLALTSELVYRGPRLDFQIDPKHGLPDHRVTLRVVYDIDENGERRVKEKYLIFTDGKNWQRWINVNASIKTNGFDAEAFPYFELKAPHFDGDEFIDYVVRPPMYAPEITPVTPDAADISKQNFMLKKSTQFAYRYLLTDRRPTALSWYSTPFFIEESTTDINDTNAPRCVDLKLYAGSAYVEQIQIVTRNCKGDWQLYDTIDKFKATGNNAAELIGTEYWKRTNPWDGLNYNPQDNTLIYRYCGDKGTSEFSVSDANLIQNDIPLLSYALTNAGDSLLWANNLYFYPNIEKPALDNLKISVIDSVDQESCSIKNVKITVYAFIGRNGEVGQVVFKEGADGESRYFGGLRPYGSNVSSFAFDMDEVKYFGLTLGNTDGFVCYLAGTSYTAIGKQYRVDPAGNKTLVGVVDIYDQSLIKDVYELYKAGGYYMQQFEFTVPAGKYIARIARHGVDLNEDYESTSTYVMGVADRSQLNVRFDQVYPFPAKFTNTRKGIEVDASAGDVDTWSKNQFLYIFTPYILHDEKYRFVEGYVKEDAESNIGVELVDYFPQLGDVMYERTGFNTDHNGFYFSYSGKNRAQKTEIYFGGKFNCAIGDYLFNTKINQELTGYFPGVNLYLKTLNGGKVGFANYVLLKGRVVDCKTGRGLSNIGVTLNGTQTYYTDADGYYVVKSHDMMRIDRVETMYFNSDTAINGCDCSPMPLFRFDTLQSPPCQGEVERVYATYPDLQVKVLSIGGKSLKGGGRYPVSIIGHDLGGRKTSAGVIGYADIPTFMQKGNFNPSQIKLDIVGALKLPEWVKWVTFGVGTNLLFQDYTQWIGDSIKFLDTKANEVKDGGGAVRAKVTIQSLLDYNISNNFSTTATYQFVKGDILRIYDDGKGNLFDPAKNGGYLDYQILGTDFDSTVDVTDSTGDDIPDPKSFIIPFDKRLLTLKDTCGFWIELIRPNTQALNKTFFGVSGTYPVIGGEILPKSIVLDAFDTYYQRRDIKTACSGTTFNHPFESNSITDYWGDGCTSAGVRITSDPQAEQKWYLNDVMKTDELINLGRVNGLGICRTENRKQFKDQGWGGIIALHAERNIIAFICQNDYFMTDYNMNYARVDSTGRIVANLDTNLGTPYQKAGDNFGCEYDDVSTIQFYDGLVIWADRKNSGFILMNYQSAADVSKADNKSYFTNKFKNTIEHNNSLPAGDYDNIIEVITGINPANNQICITWRPRKEHGSSPELFVNNEREIFIDMAETFIYSIDMKKWIGWSPYTPEYYGRMSHARSGTEFLTFASGEAWFHNTLGKTGWMNFYGVDTDQILTVVENEDQSKLKVFQSIAVESPDVKYFIDQITTENPTLFSYVPLAYFVKKGEVFYAELLRNMNTYPDANNPVESMLMDGKSLTGAVAEFRLVADPSRSGEYSEIDNILIRLIGSEKSNK